MNTQYTQYVNEARAVQHQQDLQREAAAERALRAQRADDTPVQHSRPVYLMVLMRVLAVARRLRSHAVAH
ncbi:MAG TPA: hypothetical protein VM536_12760 [Chloroflexia bacterium]|nr:hypothetical protein [Chloroflexia bacterium]